MSQLSYPARFVKEKEGRYSVTFLDFPEGNTQGDTKQEAFAMAIDCLHTVLDWRLEQKIEIPAPSAARRGQMSVPVPLEIAPQVALYQTMREKKISNVKLAKAMKVQEGVIRRMLDPKHKSSPDKYTKALLALGRAVEVSLVSVEQ